ncbi:MAG: MsbA [Verrucomicrobia bacterium]|nr:MAG: MsbA [Verrucomicrobiota bacterium]
MELGSKVEESDGGVAQLYRRIFSFIYPYRFRFALGLATALLAGASTGTLYVALKTVTALVLRGTADFSLTVPVLGKLDLSQILGFQQWLALGENWQTTSKIAALCLIVPCFVLLRGILDFLTSYQLAWIEQRVTLDLRRKVFSRIMDRSLEFFNKRRASDLIQTVFGMTAACANASMTLAQDMVRRPAAVLAVVTVLFISDPVFMGFSFVVFPICMLPVIIFSRRVRKSGKNEQKFAGQIMGILQEALAGIRVVKSHARERFEMDRFTRSAQDVNKTALKLTILVEVVGPLVESTASLGIAGGLFYCWWRGVPFDEFMARCLALVAIYPDVKALSRTQMVMSRCRAASDGIFEMLNEPIEIQDAPGALVLTRVSGEIEFENVTFGYLPGAAPAVRGLNLKFAPGKFYALVGESGAGKSTTLSLLLRFYDPQDGRLLIDGHDLKQVAQTSLREQIGIVNQDLFLFHDTIENNIRYGRLNATHEEVREAAKIARADDFILKQPQGYATLVGDKGCNLSGGQLQRVTIARALLRDSPILLLDEATSNLDPETEQAFKDALRVLRQGRTVVAIAHRFSTILEADQIVVMDQGAVLDSGTHDELLGRCPVYERLFRLQFSSAA